MREMIERTWLVQALAIGISHTDFWGMNPHILKLYFDAHAKIRDEQNAMMHLQGIYFRDAIASTIGNAFNKKGAKPYEYPKEPYNIGAPHELTEEEKQTQVVKLFSDLNNMKKAFETKVNSSF